MRILHTSDWHIGRTFHKNSTLEPLAKVFESLVAAVAEHNIDVVLAAGDIYDSSTPSADAVKLLDEFLYAITQAGAAVVMTSGNHDSPARLGARSLFAHKSGVHVLTDCDRLADPIVITDEHGEVRFYGIPYIEPAHQRHLWSDAEAMRSQKDAIGYALDLVRTDWNKSGGRAVVLAHTFAQGAEGESCDSERDIIGGVDKVPVSYFEDFSYAALGHIHGRATLAKNVRYSGAPLHYSFSEANKPRGGWLVDLDAQGLASVEWLELPVPRPLSILTGTLEELLSNEKFDTVREHWIRAVITDSSRPMNTQKQLQNRFEHVAEIAFEPSYHHEDSNETYGERIAGKSDAEIIDIFLTAVRNGESASEEEEELVRIMLAGKERA